VFTGDVEAPWGTFAERMAIALSLPIPDGADPVAVAAGVNPGMSSWMPLTAHADEHGTPDTVMILGVTGAAGGLAVQNALALGVRRIIGVGRGTHDLKRVAGLGAATVEIVGDKDADMLAIGAALGSQAPDLVLDFLWGGVAEAALHALANIPGAGPTSYVEIGSAAGEHAIVAASLLRSRHFHLTGSGIGSFDMRRYFGQIPVYLQLIADGEVQVDAQAYPLSRAGEAWTAPAGPRPVLIAG
jgi:NADPH:quinone reductase-like Zn-dependent oxidoreductase